MSGEVDRDDPAEPPDPEGDGEPAAAAAAPPAMAMLDALRGGSADPRQALFAALAGSSGSNPQLDVLMKLFDTGLSDTAGDDLRAEIREEIRQEQAEAVAELAATAERLFAERQEARARIEAVAAAIGACAVCFGENLLCETCHGAGSPGGRAPASAEFNRYVLPAVERVRTAILRASRRRPWPRQGPAHQPSAPSIMGIPS